MPIDPITALKHETDFLSAVEMNFEAAKGKDFRGSIWQTSRHDELDRLKALLAQNRNHDREKLKSLPKNQWIALHGFERRFFWFGKKKTGVAIASVLTPLDHFASSSSQGAPAVGLGELTDHVQRLVADERVPHIVGVCSPTGFTDEARKANLSRKNVSVVLVEPDQHGGWRTISGGEGVDGRLLKIFDPENAKQKVDRVQRVIEERSVDLLTGGLSVASVATEVGLPQDVVREGFERAARSDSELRMGKRDGEFLLYRGAAAAPGEKKSMNVIDRIRQMFSRASDEAAKINLLAERRAALAQRRDRIYDDIVKLEKREDELLEQGRATTSQVPKRRIAAQVAQLRKDITRQNTTAAMLNQQINIISTDIHNLTLIQQGQFAQLPSTTELTEHAVAAEELLETLKADADLVGGLEMGQDASVVSAEELEIMKELEMPSRAKSAAKGGTETGAREKSDAERPLPYGRGSEKAEPPVRESKISPSAGQRKPADPEAI